ncbi:MAG: V-type ATP synthase subunit E [bacterium]
MGLDEIKTRVLDEARQKADARLEAARREAEAVRSQGERAAEETERRLLQKARLDAEAKRERIVTDARMTAQKAVLSKKQEALEEVFRTAMESFADSGADLREALNGAILDAVETGEETLLLPPADREEWGGSLVDELNRELADRGRKGAVRLSEEDPGIASGAVLRRAGVEVNLSLEVMARQARERLEDSVAELLFGSDDSSEATH